MNQSKIRGVVFDLDGTLIRSTIDFPKMKRRMIAILEGGEIPGGRLSPTDTTVVTMEKAERIWEEKGVPEAERTRVRAEINEVMNRTELEAVSTVEEVEGAGEAVRRLKEEGYRLAVLTRGHNAYAMESLRKTGMLGFFDLILGRNETPRPKPYAEALKHTVGLMGLGLDEIVFVGDHPIDATCAKNASARFIGVLTGWTKAEVWKDHGEKTILNSVGDLPDYLAKQ
jgi:HAD superfamily hydrolase (TIGR01549 family)